MPDRDADRLREHLVASRLAGDVATRPAYTYDNCRNVISGHIDYTFGLSDWRDANEDEVRRAVATVCGAEAVSRDPDAWGWIDPEAVLAAISRHRSQLVEVVQRAGRVLLATGHPTGLLAHYAAIGRALHAAGCELPLPLDDQRDLVEQGDRKLGIRFVGDVGCAWSGGELMHTHRSGLMEAMLDRLEEEGRRPDLVVADHGMAGAAVERGIPTLSIADVNDPALMLAQLRGRTDAVLPIDDNLAPRLFEPVTRAMLRGLPSG